MIGMFENIDMTSGIADIFTGLWIILIMAVVAAALFYFLFFRQFKNHVRIRVVSGNRSIIIDDKARVINDGGVKKWQLLRRREKIPLPPAKALSVNSKGKYCVELLYDEESREYHYIEDNIDINKLTGFDPLTTNQREMLIGEIRRANERGGKSWKEIVQQAVPYIALTLMVLGLMIFYGDIAAPVLKMGDVQAEITQQQSEMLGTIQEMIESKQIFINNPGETPPG